MLLTFFNKGTLCKEGLGEVDVGQENIMVSTDMLPLNGDVTFGGWVKATGDMEVLLLVGSFIVDRTARMIIIKTYVNI